MKADPAQAPSRLRNRRGAILIVVSVSMVALLGMLALTVDLGAGRRERRIAQTAADAGAIGGGQEILRGTDSASVVAGAKYSAINRNQFLASEVSVFYPPQSGNHIGNKRYVEVRIARSIPTIFGGIFNRSSLNVGTRAVAGVDSVGGLYCVWGLAGPPPANSIDLSGDMGANCGVQANGDIYVKKDLEAPIIASVGLVEGQQGDFRTGIPPFNDPLASLPVPTQTAPCDYTGFKVTGNMNLLPGVYCGGITYQGNNRTANLAAGTYVMRGGGIDGTANGSTLTGTNVTIINTNGPGNSVAQFGPISFGNNCYTGLTAPTSGTYKGILIFQDPAGPAGLVNEICGKGPGSGGQGKCDFTAGQIPDMVGAIYLPTQIIRVGNSNGKWLLEGAIISAGMLTGNGGGRYCVKNEPTAWSALLRLTLVE